MVARFAVKSGQVALYTVPTPTSTDDSPLTDPLNNLDRVIVHPALRIPGVVTVLTGTLTLPALTNGSYAKIRSTHVLGAHGQTGRPMIVGKLTGLGVGGKAVPWVGAVPVQSFAFFGGGTPYIVANGGTRWLTLGVNGGNIVAYHSVVGYSATNAAISLTYEVLVLSRDLAASLPSGGPTRVRVSGNAFLFETPGGSISSEHRFIRKADAGTGFAISGGRTCKLRFNDRQGGAGSAIINFTTANWSVGSGIFEREFRYFYDGSSYTDKMAGSVDPVVQEVRI